MKLITAATTFTRNNENFLKFDKIIVLTNGVAATNAHFVTIAATNKESVTRTMTFSALVGEYCAAFEFGLDETVVITPATDTVALFESFSYSKN